MLDILGTKKEVLNLLLGNTPMILFHLTFVFFNLICYIHLFLDFIYFFNIMFLSFISGLTLFFIFIIFVFIFIV